MSQGLSKAQDLEVATLPYNVLSQLKPGIRESGPPASPANHSHQQWRQVTTTCPGCSSSSTTDS
eukprot:3009652-Amphidinium_carterae.2